METLDAIRRMCETSGQKSPEVSRAIGRSRNYVSTMFTAGANPRTDTLLKLAHACGYEVVLESQDTSFELTDALDAIRRMLDESGLRITEASLALGRRRTFVPNMFTRGSVPLIDTLIQIAHVCGYEVVLVGHGERIELEPTEGKEKVRQKRVFMSPSDAIRRMCDTSGQTLVAVSRLIGRSRVFVSNMLSSGVTPRLDTLLMIAKACGYRVVLEGQGERIELVLPTESVDGTPPSEEGQQ